MGQWSAVPCRVAAAAAHAPHVTRARAQNFLALAASGYYDGTKFHRNIRGFMIQGGDPTGASAAVSVLQARRARHLSRMADAALRGGLDAMTARIAGTGKGGECIWGGKFEDEFHPDLRVRGGASVGRTWWASVVGEHVVPCGSPVACITTPFPAVPSEACNSMPCFAVRSVTYHHAGVRTHRMRLSMCRSTTSVALCRWPTRARTPTGPSFL